MKFFTKKALLFSLLSLFGVTMINAQGGGTIEPQAITTETSSITLKTVRALFPDQPVAVANELFGGLHSVQSAADLNGAGLDTSMLQIGMLVYVADANMYYRYKGENGTGALNGAGALADQDVNGVNTVYWESLADVIAAVTGTHVYDDTTGIGSAIYEGDVYLAGDTTFAWDGTQWAVMALNELDSVYQAKDSFDIAVSGDVAVELDTTWIYNGTQWLVAAVQPSVTMDNVFVGLSGTRTASGNTTGDIYIEPDTTFAWDGKKWQTLALNEKDSVFAGDRDSLSSADSMLIGDIVNDNDSIFIYNGKKWTLISVLPSAKVDSFQVYVDTAGTAISWLGKAADQDGFRGLIHAAVSSTLKGTNGVVLYYPAKWGDFTYSIGYPVITPTMTIELTNGVSVTTVEAASGPQAEGTYKKVTISSRNATVHVD